MEQIIDQSRFKSPVVWVNVITALLVLLGHLGLYEKFGIDKTAIQYIFDTFVLILNLFGFLNNPTTKNLF